MLKKQLAYFAVNLGKLARRNASAGLLLLISISMMALNVTLRNLYENLAEPECNTGCSFILRYWASCAPVVSNSIIINLLNMFDAFISFFTLAFPMVMGSILSRVFYMLSTPSARHYLEEINSSLASFACVRLIKGRINTMIHTGNIGTLGSLTKRPVLVSETCALSETAGFPSGHAFTAVPEAIENASAAVSVTQLQSRLALAKHRIGLVLSTYAVFTRYALGWHTPMQLFLTGILSSLFFTLYKIAKNLLLSAGLSRHTLELTINYLSHVAIIASKHAFFPELWPDFIGGHILRNPALLYCLALTINLFLDIGIYFSKGNALPSASEKPKLA